MRIASITTLILCLFIQVKSQSILPLPASTSARWAIESYSSGTATVGPYYWYSYLRNDTNGNIDTNINAHVYHKLYYCGINVCNVYIGAYRSDSTGKSYFIPHSESAEQLIMDAGAQVGDTVRSVLSVANVEMLVYSSPVYYFLNYVVDSASYLQAFNRNLRVVYTHPEQPPFSYDPNMWIETVGSIWGLLNAEANGLNYDHTYCMSENDTSWYTCTSQSFNPWPYSIHADTGTCPEAVYFTVGTAEAQNENLLTITPNPFADHIVIQSSHSTSEPLRCTLTSIHGQLVSSALISPGTAWYIPELTEGTYILECWQENTCYRQLLIKQ